MQGSTTAQKVTTVSELTRQIKLLLEESFYSAWVAGEISNLSRPGSGHIYLTLKDAHAQIRAVLWRSTARRLQFELREGLAVIVRANISVYPPRGDYQLIIDELQPRGIGAADLALRQLKEKLLGLGYFALERKRTVPAFPRQIGLVTSPSGAAVRDILEILGRRWPLAQVWICPVRVQGLGAEEEIAAGIADANSIPGLEVLIVARGGGRSEDLSAFNREIVARAIFHSRAPVVSAVGHEIDVTIADLVADKRALTPSEAAELVSPDCSGLLRDLHGLGARLSDQIVGRLAAARDRCEHVLGRRPFARPLERIRDHERRLDDTEGRLKRAIRQRVLEARRLADSWAARLESLSPLSVLARGYSLTRKERDQCLIRSSDQIQPGDRLLTLVHHGRILSRVEEVLHAERCADFLPEE